MSAPGESVLILEDDPGVARLQKVRLERAGFGVSSSGVEASKQCIWYRST